MFDCESRGVLETAGKPWSDEDALLSVGWLNDAGRSALAELFDKGVLSRRRNGAIYSRRMVRDEERRKASTDRQRVCRSKQSRDSHDDVTLMSQGEVRSQKLEVRSQKNIPSNSVLKQESLRGGGSLSGETAAAAQNPRDWQTELQAAAATAAALGAIDYGELVSYCESLEGDRAALPLPAILRDFARYKHQMRGQRMGRPFYTILDALESKTQHQRKEREIAQITYES